ncbi:DUF4287 domain-containing protein [Novosphingobium sp. PS1R-30]|uniref:DUF4287 domain-containing protein n=1 Tax=Novosphingobium anseongense TaxID=3133436 RepID=A0ABU8RQM0_9SPHN|nr:MAG: DUF4287 domain-containing protein [Novosphingobium sp.]
MSFQAYLDNIEAKTGKNPAGFRAWGKDKGFGAGAGLAPGVKAGEIVTALKDEFGLGHGHAMAIVALLKGAKKEGDA